MSITLSKSCLNETESLNRLYNAACKFFKSIDPDPRGTPPEECITQGCLPPNGIFDNYRIYSIYLDDDIIGYCDYYLGYPDKNTAYISFLYIDETFRGKGYATQALKIICNQLVASDINCIRLTVSLKNWHGLKFWVNNGFQNITLVDVETDYGADKYGALELEMHLQ